MKLEKFKVENNKRKFIIIFTVCCVFLLAGVFLYTSFAIFTEDKQFNVINGTYQDPGDLYFAVYVDDQITSTIPSKDSGYTLDTERSSCTNGAAISWDNTNWTAIVNLSNYSSGNMSRTKCTMYFKEMEFTDSVIACNDTAANCLMKNASKNTIELVYDETVDNNLRYIGADPNNYVSFNNELWRIIGVMNNIDDGTGKKESRLKIIRDESVGTYSWDNKNGVGSSDSIYGSNDWSDSTLQVVLNSGAYWNRTSGQCPVGERGRTEACDFTTSGLTTDAKNMIGNAVWNLGGVSSFSNLTSTFYASERGTEVYSGRPTTWTGKVALMYPSDYGYATSGGSSIDRNTCLSYDLGNWDSYSDCRNNDWLYVMDRQWLLTPVSQASESVYSIWWGGNLSGNITGDGNFLAKVNPVVYLSSNIIITGGDGSESNPFTLSL